MTASHDQMDAVKDGKKLTWLGILILILGIAALFAPRMAGLSVAMLIGVSVFASGILRLIWVFQTTGIGHKLLGLLLAAITILCGIALLTDPLLASGFLTILLAVYLFSDGILELVGGFQAPAGSGKLWLIISGICSLILGGMIWSQYPLSGVWAMGIILGIKLFLMGLVIIVTGSTVKSLAKEASA